MMKIDRQDSKPIWKQLLDQAMHNITSGKWKAGYRLPPTRELAQQLGVARSTVQTMYEELFSRGYTITSRRGGTQV
ncbi:MAG: GntR family transcriptional regulator, partial [Solibacillus sp.]